MALLRAIKKARCYTISEAATIFQFHRAPSRSLSSKASKVDVEALLKTPSWSVRETLFVDNPGVDMTLINQEQLHHLLRLSALPIPASSQEEAKMIGDLKAQLRFVQAIQKVNTDGVEPLQMIRDETKEAEELNTITMDALKKDFEKEEVVGSRRRIRKKATVENPEIQGKTETWNPLSHASRIQGPYFVVNIAKNDSTPKKMLSAP